MSILYFLTLILFFIWTIRNISFWLFLWQIKEYRLDRLLVHLQETNQGKALRDNWRNFLKTFYLLLYLFASPVSDSQTLAILNFAVFLIYFYDTLVTLIEVKNRRLKRPLITLKTTTVAILTLTLVTVLLPFEFVHPLFILLALDRLTPLFIAFFLGIFSFPSRLYHKHLIAKAENKLRQNPKLTVLGITGCYGKGSTKEYLSTILQDKFNVAKTFETYNTPIGIAQSILKDVNRKTNFFIAEIGAYKIGEVKEICDIIHPKIGIITAVSDQHLSLFGSLDNLKKATYELVESLPGEGLAVFNGNSRETNELYKKTKIAKTLCFVQNNTSEKLKGDITALKIEVARLDLAFDVYLSYRRLGKIKVKLLGRHHVENLLPAVFLALKFGLTFSQIQKAAQKIFPWKKTMEPYLSSSGVIFIDDTFNASPGATAAAVDYMTIYKGKKILVLQPFIELGRNSARDHFETGKRLGETCDYLFLTNDNFFESLSRGVAKSKGKCRILIASAAEIAHFITKNTAKDDIVVFEGKEAGLTLTRLSCKPVFRTSL